MRRAGNWLLGGAWALYVVSLALPAVRSSALSMGRVTYGWEIVLAFPLLILNPLSLTHPLLWLYIMLLWSPNLVMVFSQRLYHSARRRRLSVVFFKLLGYGMLCALSVAVGVPGLLGAPVESLLPGSYSWVVSLALAGAAFALLRAAAESPDVRKETRV